MTNNYLDLKEAVSHLPGKWNPRSVLWAMNKGTSTPAGIIKLRRTKHKGRVMTTAAWIKDYLDAIDDSFMDPTPPTSSPAAARPSGFKTAQASLAAEGLS